MYITSVNRYGKTGWCVVTRSDGTTIKVNGLNQINFMLELCHQGQLESLPAPESTANITLGNGHGFQQSDSSTYSANNSEQGQEETDVHCFPEWGEDTHIIIKGSELNKLGELLAATELQTREGDSDTSPTEPEDEDIFEEDKDPSEYLEDFERSIKEHARNVQESVAIAYAIGIHEGKTKGSSSDSDNTHWIESHTIDVDSTEI